jgi:glucokinase
MKLIGVDVGGTKISSGLVDHEKIVRQSTLPTPFDRPQYEVVNTVIQSIDEVYDPGVEGIGIGVPGLVDRKEQCVLDVTNIPSWDSVPLAELVSDYFNKPVFVNNDANCFAIGEKYFGKGKPYANFVGLIIGTGMGAGIIINNHLYEGRLCGAGEFGNIYYRDKNIEAYASGLFFRDKGIDGKMLFKRAAIGDPLALKVFEDLGKNIGRAVANILFAIAPEAVIFGGSVSKAYKYFGESMHEFLEDNFPFRRLYHQLAIEISENEESGILGASSLVLESKMNK